MLPDRYELLVDEADALCVGVIDLSVETAESMPGSYVIINLRERPYRNAGGRGAYGEPVDEAGFLA